MPYPIAHPAAILPLLGPLGRHAVPSALVIGCLVPDAWYFVPPLTREESHGAAGLLWFCVPVGLLVYLVFHILLKEPLLALLPESIASKLPAFPRWPSAGWPAVLLCLLIGAGTHVAWDALAHAHRVLQHASTLIGTAVVVTWSWRRLRAARASALPSRFRLSPAVRLGTLAALVVLSMGWAGWVAAAEAIALPGDATELRYALRTAGLAGAQALCLSTIGYAILWKVLR